METAFCPSAGRERLALCQNRVPPGGDTAGTSHRAPASRLVHVAHADRHVSLSATPGGARAGVDGAPLGSVQGQVKRGQVQAWVRTMWLGAEPRAGPAVAAAAVAPAVPSSAHTADAPGTLLGTADVLLLQTASRPLNIISESSKKRVRSCFFFESPAKSLSRQHIYSI